jgi:hypothetical protein
MTAVSTLSRRNLLVTAASVAIGNSQDPPLPTTRSKYYGKGGAEPIPIKSKVWKSAPSALYEYEWNGKVHRPELATKVSALWNQQNFYLLFECKYLTLHWEEKPDYTTDQPLYNRDCVEFFIANDPSDMLHYREFEIGPQGDWFDALIAWNNGRIKVDQAWNSGVRIAAAIDKEKKEWRVSVAVSVSQLGGKLAKGDRWRINFYRIETPERNTRKSQFLAWSPTLTPRANFHVPQRFGWIEFI